MNRKICNDMRKLNVFTVVTASLFLSAALCGCQRENVSDMPAKGEKACYFGTEILGNAPATRSLLTASDIETKVTSVTLAAYKYDGGTPSLEKTGYYTSNFSAMPLILMKDETYDVYAFVNMGDVSSRVPTNPSALSSTMFSVPSYSQVNTNGIPMSGVRSGFVPAEAGSQTVSVRRLFARVNLNLTCDWEGASIAEVKIYNMNGALPLYGEAKATTAADILSFQELGGSSTTGSGDFVMYVPENMQGTIDGIEDSASKSHEGNETVASKRNVLTYIEGKVVLSDLYDGTIYFRSYLGNNATDNFDIAGNCIYDWKISYHEEGISLSNWKTDAQDVVDHRYLEVEEEIELAPGASAYYYELIDTNIPLSKIYAAPNKSSSVYSDHFIQMQNGGGFTVSPDAAVGEFCYIRVIPRQNATDELEKAILVTVVEE